MTTVMFIDFKAFISDAVIACCLMLKEREKERDREREREIAITWCQTHNKS